MTKVFCDATQQSMKISSDNFKNCVARAGSVIVSFEIQATDEAAGNTYYDQLYVQWKDGTADVSVTINGVEINFPATSVKKEGQDYVHTKPYEKEDEDDSTLVVLLVVFFLLAIIIAIVVCLYIFVYKKKQKVSSSFSSSSILKSRILNLFCLENKLSLQLIN